jgi:hypothetical protein
MERQRLRQSVRHCEGALATAAICLLIFRKTKCACNVASQIHDDDQFVFAKEHQRPRQSVRHCDCLRAEHGAPATAAKRSSLRLLACGAWSVSDRGNLPVSFIPSSSEFLTYLADLFSPCTQGLYSNQKADCHDPLPINAEDERLFGLAKGLAVTEQRGKAIRFVIGGERKQSPQKDSSLRGSASD